MKLKTKRDICAAIGWVCFLLTIGIVGGVETQRLSITALLWMIPTVAAFGFCLNKAGWLNVRP